MVRRLIALPAMVTAAVVCSHLFPEWVIVPIAGIAITSLVVLAIGTSLGRRRVPVPPRTVWDLIPDPTIQVIEPAPVTVSSVRVSNLPVAEIGR